MASGLYGFPLFSDLALLCPAGAVSFATEAGHFQATGVPAAIIGPGSIDQAHKPDEYVDQSQLDDCEDFLRKVIAHAAKAAPDPA